MALKLNSLENKITQNPYERFPAVDLSSKAKLYAYSVNTTIQLDNVDDKDPQDISDYVMGVSIEKNFEKMFCPLIKLVLNIPRGLAFSIQDNFRDVSLFFTLERHEVSSIERGTISSPEAVYKGAELSIINIEGDAFIDDDATTGDIDVMPTKNTKDDVVLTLYMYEKSALEVKRPLLNKVYNNVTISDVLNYLVANNFKNRKVVIDAPENEEEYEQIFIPPLSFPDIIEYLQAFYGIYRSGVEVFMDIDTLYIISKDTEAKNGELYNSMYIRTRASKQKDAESAAKGTRSTFIDEDSKVVNITLDNRPNIESGDVLSKEFIGEHLYINNDSKLDIAVGGGGINPSELGEGKERFLWSRSSSVFATDEIALRINRSTEISNFFIENTDIRYFNPVTVIHLGYAFKTNDDVEAEYRFSLVHSSFTRGEDSIMDDTYKNIFYEKTYARFIRV